MVCVTIVRFGDGGGKRLRLAWMLRYLILPPSLTVDVCFLVGRGERCVPQRLLSRFARASCRYTFLRKSKCTNISRDMRHKVRTFFRFGLF